MRVRFIKRIVAAVAILSFLGMCLEDAPGSEVSFGTFLLKQAVCMAIFAISVLVYPHISRILNDR